MRTRPERINEADTISESPSSWKKQMLSDGSTIQMTIGYKNWVPDKDDSGSDGKSLNAKRFAFWKQGSTCAEWDSRFPELINKRI